MGGDLSFVKRSGKRRGTMLTKRNGDYNIFLYVSLKFILDVFGARRFPSILGTHNSGRNVKGSRKIF